MQQICNSNNFIVSAHINAFQNEEKINNHQPTPKFIDI